MPSDNLSEFDIFCLHIIAYAKAFYHAYGLEPFLLAAIPRSVVAPLERTKILLQVRLPASFLPSGCAIWAILSQACLFNLYLSHADQILYLFEIMLSSSICLTSKSLSKQYTGRWLCISFFSNFYSTPLFLSIKY